MHKPLSLDDIRRFAPSVFATRPVAEASERYGFVPTSEIVQSLMQQGFVCTDARESRVRLESRLGFSKHMLRFRHPDMGPAIQPGVHKFIDDGPVFPEIVIENSHDLTSAYGVQAGFMRQICLNGAVVSIGDVGVFRVPHRKEQMGEVIDATYRVIEEMPLLTDHVIQWSNLPVPVSHQLEYAKKALALRWDEGKAPIVASKLLEPRRHADNKQDIWHVFNRVQENIIRGGVRYIHEDANHRRFVRRTREIKSVNSDLDLNRKLWTLTNELEEELVGA